MDAYEVHTRKRRSRAGTRITVPARVGPHVRLLFTEMQRQNVTYEELSADSGVNVPTIKAWRHRNTPTLTSVEAALGALGYDLVPVPRAKILPPEIVESLRDVGTRLGMTVAETIQVLVEIVTGIHERFDEQPNALVSEPS